MSAADAPFKSFCIFAVAAFLYARSTAEDGSFALISFSISPLRTAASICFLRAEDLSKFLDIALINCDCRLPDLIDPFKSPPSCYIILLASINES